MRPIFVCIIVTVAASVFGADSDVKQVREHFKSDNYTVQWGTARTFDPGAELEIGDGSGHGFTLNWLRFRPGEELVDVLSFRRRPGKDLRGHDDLGILLCRRGQDAFQVSGRLVAQGLSRDHCFPPAQGVRWPCREAVFTSHSSSRKEVQQ
jgi:hypothetical protein